MPQRWERRPAAETSHLYNVERAPLIVLVSACLLGLASAQFEDICAGANGNTPCCYSNGGAGPDSTYLFMSASDVESNLLLCLANGGHLAYINTVAENDCLNQYIQEGKYVVLKLMYSISILNIWRKGLHLKQSRAGGCVLSKHP